MTQPFGGYKQSGNARDKCFDSLHELHADEIRVVPPVARAAWLIARLDMRRSLVRYERRGSARRD